MVLVAFAIDPFSLREVLLLLLNLPQMECLFNKQELKLRQTRLSTRAEATVACGGFCSANSGLERPPRPAAGYPQGAPLPYTSFTSVSDMVGVPLAGTQ